MPTSIIIFNVHIVKMITLIIITVLQKMLPKYKDLFYTKEVNFIIFLSSNFYASPEWGNLWFPVSL